MKSITFVYAKGDEIELLNYLDTELFAKEKQLLENGYTHTHTIDLELFIKNLSEMSDKEIVEQIRKLSKKTNL